MRNNLHPILHKNEPIIPFYALCPNHLKISPQRLNPHILQLHNPNKLHDTNIIDRIDGDCEDDPILFY